MEVGSLAFPPYRWLGEDTTAVVVRVEMGASCWGSLSHLGHLPLDFSEKENFLLQALYFEVSLF